MPKILIVSADFNFATLLEARLLMEDHRVSIAGDGVLGFEKARELEPQVIILDAALPKMSGYQLIEKLKIPGGSLRHIPIIVVADRARMEYLFRDADIFHFCSKPVIPALFLKQIAEAVKYFKTPSIPEKETGKGSPHVLLAGVQEFVMGKLKKFLEEKGFTVDIGWGEEDLVQKAVRMKPAYIFVQYWEVTSILDAPQIIRKLIQQNVPQSSAVFVFCARNILQDAIFQLPVVKVIAFRESRDLLEEVERVLKTGQANHSGRKPTQ